MKYYINSENEMFGFELDGSQDHLITKDLIEITLEDVIKRNEETNKIAFNELSYQEKRALEYPNFRDYLDGIVKNDQTQIDAYINACQAVKNKYPKP